jgi:hypothetical protein
MSVNFAADSTSPYWQDRHGHGTHAAGIIAAKKGSPNGVEGVVPGATVVAVRVLNDYGQGLLSRALRGVEYVSTKGKKGDVAFIGVNWKTSDEPYGNILRAAVQNAADKGIKFAIQAGDYSTFASYYTPASASGANIYTVSAYDQSDKFYLSSNYGAAVDYGGPGVSIPSLDLDLFGQLTVRERHGTSPAAAHIAGLLLTGKIASYKNVKEDRDSRPDPIAVYPKPKNLFNIKIFTDRWGSETAFTLRRMSPGTPTTVVFRTAGSLEDLELYDCSMALDKGEYELIFTDTYGDGLESPGYYTLALGGNVFKTGGSFSYLDTTSFVVDVIERPSTTNLECQVLTAFGAAPSLVTTAKASKPVTKVTANAPKPVTKVTPKPVTKVTANAPKPVKNKNLKTKK